MVIIDESERITGTDYDVNCQIVWHLLTTLFGTTVLRLSQ
jgi:hypothetical protein